ncbi:MAG: glycoside hydrolase family 172 protein [Sphingobacterium sp.]
MMKGTALFYPVALLIALFSTAELHGQRQKYDVIQELENMQRADQLPLYRSGEYIGQISSYDRTGGNDDGFDGTYSFIRKENGHLVIADLKGPGVVNRIWTPTPTDDTMAFYFDGETQPRLRIKFSDLFSGEVFPFLKGLSGNEIGGYYTYLPIPYEKSLKIVLEGEKMLFHQVQYRELPEQQVRSWSPDYSSQERSKLEEVAALWEKGTANIEQFSYGHSAEPQISEKTIVIAPGEEQSLFEDHQGGRIVGLELEAGSGFEGVYKDVLIAAKWDQEEHPAIYAPVADFFGYAYGQKEMRGLLMGSTADVNYSYIPMPYDQSAEIKLIYKNRSDVEQSPISVRVKVYHNQQARDPETEGKLYTHWKRLKPETGEYHEFLVMEGRGHYVGTIHQAQGLRAGMTLFFEGDDVTKIDGEQRLHGTGSEDYYNGGWYALLDRWDRGISLPVHGSLDYSLPMGRTGGYRFFMSDKMPFEKEIYHVMEHGPEGNEFPVDYTSIAFYYADKAGIDPNEPTEELREVFLPREHQYFPQLMEITLAAGAKVELDRGLRIHSDTHHSVRVMLTDVPEGTYELSINYFEKPEGADFAIWQRQKKVADWISSGGESETLKEKISMGEIVITPQTNSVTFHVKKNDQFGGEFELDRIFLDRID